MTVPLTSPFTSGTAVTKLQLDQLVASINTIAFGYLGEASGIGTGTLSSTGTYYAGQFSVTITLTTTRRIRVDVLANVGAAATNGRYVLRAAYNTGSTIGTPSLMGSTVAFNCPTATEYGVTNFATVLLTAGTYTFYGAVERVSGGTSSDTFGTQRVIVADAGDT